MTKKVCVIGFGEMGKRHSKDLEEFSDGNIEIAGVFEPSDKSYQRGCEWMEKDPQRFNSIEGMLDEINPDGCVISTPNSTHLECLQKFKGRKIPLILEKPLETNMEKVRDVVDFVEKYNAPVMVHHVMRFSPIVLKAKELIEEGRIGRVAGFEMVQFIHGHMFHNFRRTFKTGGGQLLEKATHDFDVLLFLTGSMPKRVASICKRQYYGGDMPNELTCSQCDKADECKHSTTKSSGGNDTNSSKDLCVFAREIDIFDYESCVIELENGVSGTYSECFFSKAPFSRRYEIMGTEGFLSIDFSLKKIDLSTSKGTETFEFDYEGRIHYNGAPGVARHFLQLMNRETDKVLSPVDEAFAAELISFAAYRSNSTGNFVKISGIM